MRPEDWERAETWFHRLAPLDTDARRAALAEVAADDSALAGELELLLAGRRPGGAFDRLSSLLTPESLGLPPTDELVGRVIRHYEIGELVGRGGMGDVYRARDTRLGRDVALKFLPRWLNRDPSAKDRFLVEARMISSLDHPNVCTLLEIGESDDGHLFLIMPFYEGETLKARLERGPLTSHEAVEIALQAARGLGAAHQRGIVHRDLKPGNLLITDEGRVKLLDFGVAKLADVSLTQPGQTPGTASYMSPEQARGDTVDHRTDLWSLGVVLYEMLTGRRPFGGDRPAAVLHAIEHGDPPPASSLRTELDPAVEDALDMLLAKAPSDRFASARAFVEFFEDPAARTDLPTRRARVPPEGERRQATVVVSLLSGYVELVERFDPAEARGMLDRVHSLLEEIAERHGGVVNRRGGEECVYLFGVAAAHEDDHRRAVRAAQEAHAGVRVLDVDGTTGLTRPFLLRTGIDTGQVVVRPLRGQGARFELAGWTSRRAARLAASASPDEILVSEPCLSLIQPFFTTEARPELPVSGVEPSLHPHAVTGPSGLQTRFEAAARLGLTPLTGREAELEALGQCLDAAMEGAGGVVTVHGEAGVGKSRLLHEFERGLDRSAVDVVRGRCSNLTGETAYLPFIGAVRDRLGLDTLAPGDGPATALGRLVRAIDPQLEDFLPFFALLLSIDGGDALRVPAHLRGEGLHIAMQDSITALLTLGARRRPTVLLLEDWHWADGASDAELRQLAGTARDCPLLIVVTSRGSETPGRDGDAPAALGTNLHPPIIVEALDSAASVAMLRSLLGAVSVPADLAALLHARTGGNPFFLEEICRTLTEAGALRVENGEATLDPALDARRLPSTVQSIISTRLDRLGRDARELVRLASVTGREFDRDLLEQTFPARERLSAALAALISAGLVEPSEPVTRADGQRTAGASAYRFRHVLVQEAAYASVLQHQRRELHGRVGEAIERLYGSEAGEYLDRLTHHFSQAEAWERAVEYGIRSAERAYDFSQFPEALDMFDRVADWLSRLPDSASRRAQRADVRLHQEHICELLGQRDRQQAIIDELVTLLDPVADRTALTEVYLRQGDLYLLLNRYDEAEQALLHVLATSRQVSDLAGRRKALRSLGLLRCRQQRFEEALAFGEEALELDREHGDEGAVLGDLANIGHILLSDGQAERARAVLEEALRLAAPRPAAASGRSDDDPHWQQREVVLHNLARAHHQLGDVEEAIVCLEQAIGLATDRRNVLEVATHTWTLARMHIAAGRLEAGLGHYRSALDMYERVRFAPGAAQQHRRIGEVMLALDRSDEAIFHLNASADGFAGLHDGEAEAVTRARLAELYEHIGDGGSAMTEWTRARALTGQTGSLSCALKAAEGLARTARVHLSEPGAALGHYQDALRITEELDDGSSRGRILNAMGILEWDRGDFGAALEHFRAGLWQFRKLGDEAGAGQMENSIGVTLKALGRREEARETLEKAIVRHRSAGRSAQAGYALAMLGDLCVENQDADEARAYYEASLEIRRELGDRAGEGWMLHGLARARAVRGDSRAARDHLDEAAEVARELADADLAAACEEMRRTAGLTM